MTEVNKSSSLFLLSLSPGKRLRIAVLADEAGVPGHALDILNDLYRTDFLDPAVILLPGSPSRPRAGSALSRFGRGLFALLDRSYGYRSHIDAQSALPADLPGTTIRRAGSARQVPIQDFDILIDLRVDPHVDELDDLPAGGIWWLQFGRAPLNDEWPPYARELVSETPGRCVRLMRRVPGSKGDEALSTVEFSNSPRPSPAANSEGVLKGCAYLVIQKLWELHSQGPEFVERRVTRHEASWILPAPTPVSVIRWMLLHIGKKIRNRLWASKPPLQWRIGLRRSATSLLEQGGAPDISDFKWFDLPVGSLWADPFLFEHEGLTWVFFEEGHPGQRKAHISCGYLDDNGQLREIRPVLDRHIHMSYPQVFRFGNEIYMLPESIESGGVDLYRATSFPDFWEPVERLIDFPCVDCTVFQQDATWWMFASPIRPGGHAPETWIFKSDKPSGPWKYDPSGPLSRTARTARGAGQLFVHAGRLVRPSQDCLVTYGSAVNFQHVEGLGTGRCSKLTFNSLRPIGGRKMGGIHTFNRVGEWEVIDGLLPDVPPDRAIGKRSDRNGR